MPVRYHIVSPTAAASSSLDAGGESTSYSEENDQKRLKVRTSKEGRRKATVKEVLSEFEALRQENGVLKEKIEEQTSALDFLRKSGEQRESLIEELRKEIKKLRVTAKQEFDMFAEEMKTKSMEDEFKIKTLSIEKSRMESEMHIYKFYEQENAELRSIVKSLHAQLEKLSHVKTLESQTSVVELEKFRKQIESEYQKKFEESVSRQEPVTKNDGVWDAIVRSGLFKEVMVNRPPSDINVFLEQIRSILSQNEKLKRDKQVRDEDLIKRENLIREMQIKQLSDQEKIRLLEEDVYDSKNASADNDVLHTELDVMANELTRLTERYKTSMSEMEKWRGRALALKHVDIDLTPRKLSKLLDAKEEMIQSARNTVKNIKKNVDEEVEKPAISVLQALSMWNTNFSNVNTSEMQQDQPQLHSQSLPESFREEEFSEPVIFEPLQKRAVTSKEKSARDRTCKIVYPNEHSQSHSLLSLKPKKKKSFEEEFAEANKSLSVMSKQKKKGQLPSHLVSLYKSFGGSNTSADSSKNGSRFLVP